ncbi:thermonuclease family protein [Baekduia soli]|uniref:Thermonuclease family protein n=1 Tax=Baekduia soli TaxID=496014 RepID=A0A5B8U3E6_9ACTN|nr:thermonuclease family protein [Baekduia soli]QEC47510.1 thermonuclease family protein [Baekduia soli]
MRRWLPWVLLVLLAAAYGCSRAPGGPGPSATTAMGDATPAGGRDAQVARVVDGDTLLVRVGGARERVRLIGIDTPESVKPGTPVQCYGREASAATRRLLDGRDVRLVADAEPRDRFGRLLAYVYREPDGLLVNTELARLGFARALTIAPNVRFASRIAALVRAARDAGRGLWGACGR